MTYLHSTATRGFVTGIGVIQVGEYTVQALREGESVRLSLTPESCERIRQRVFATVEPLPGERVMSGGLPAANYNGPLCRTWGAAFRAECARVTRQVVRAARLGQVEGLPGHLRVVTR